MVMHRSTVQVFLCVAAVLFAQICNAWSAERFALIIGNEDYLKVEALKNPKEDVLLLESSLKEAKFEVELKLDLKTENFEQVVDSFVQRMTEKHNNKIKIEALIFYYAGHGVQFAGQNYLLPIDVVPTEESILQQGINLNRVIAKFNSVPANSYIFVLDACRNNPLGTTEAGSGLAEVDAGPNNYLFFSARPGAVAADGQSDNSPFASALGSEIRKQGLPIEAVARNVRGLVYKETGGIQLPWDSSSLMAEFEFIPLTQFGSRESIVSETDKEEALWALAVQTEFSDGALRKYLLIFPNGKYSHQALEELNKQ
jgi:uncharacterized protein